MQSLQSHLFLLHWNLNDQAMDAINAKEAIEAIKATQAGQLHLSEAKRPLI